MLNQPIDHDRDQGPFEGHFVRVNNYGTYDSKLSLFPDIALGRSPSLPRKIQFFDYVRCLGSGLQRELESESGTQLYGMDDVEEGSPPSHSQTIRKGVSEARAGAADGVEDQGIELSGRSGWCRFLVRADCGKSRLVVY